MKLLILNGPNLNMLGIREPEIYGTETYGDLMEKIRQHAFEKGIDVAFYQSNHEGDLVDAIQRAYSKRMDGIVFNPGAYTHTSIAIMDAVKAVGLPTAEVHISDVSAREPFRRTSYIGRVAVCTISGQGLEGYCTAMDYLEEYIGGRR